MGVPRIRPKSSTRSESHRALQVLIEETAELNHAFGTALGEARAAGEAPAMRPALRRLFRAGPQTVPQLARQQRVSRQHLQTIVNGLLKRGWVETIANPAHRRSPLFKLTSAGASALNDADAGRRGQLERASKDISASTLYEAVQVLRRLRGLLNLSAKP